MPVIYDAIAKTNVKALRIAVENFDSVLSYKGNKHYI